MAELGATSMEAAELMDDQALAAANARLEANGFSAFDEKGNLKNVLDIYRELYMALGEVAGGFEDIDRNEDALSILSAIFPTRTITEALTLLRGAAEGYDGLYESMKGGDAAGYNSGIPQNFNWYIDSYNSALREAVSGSPVLSETAERFTAVSEITGGNTTFINDGLHYSDDTLQKITEYIRSVGE